MGNKILIENYRGIEILFDKYCEKFQCIITEDNIKESLSYSAVKKHIDDYKNFNHDFKPFWVEKNAEKRRIDNERIKIIGRRKDGRLISENSKGIPEQISTYELDDYMLVFPENDSARDQLIEMQQEEERQRLERNEKCKQIISTMKIVTLKDFANSRG